MYSLVHSVIENVDFLLKKIRKNSTLQHILEKKMYLNRFYLMNLYLHINNIFISALQWPCKCKSMYLHKWVGNRLVVVGGSSNIKL